jgi:putative membrane protein
MLKRVQHDEKGGGGQKSGIAAKTDLGLRRMNFLRTLGWIVLTIVVVVFSLRNWVPVTINLFAGLQADVKLPVLLLVAFLLGFLPLYAYHRAVRWSLKKKLTNMRKMGIAPLAPEAQPIPVAPAAAVAEPFASGESF